MKSKTVGFLFDQTQECTPVLFRKILHELLLENKQPYYAAYCEVAVTCYPTDSTMCALKIARSVWQNDFWCYMLHLTTCLVKGGNDKTDRCY